MGDSLDTRPTTPALRIYGHVVNQALLPRGPHPGGPEGIRTPDLYSAIVALSQLSYRPEAERYVSAAPGHCQGAEACYTHVQTSNIPHKEHSQ